MLSSNVKLLWQRITPSFMCSKSISNHGLASNPSPSLSSTGQCCSVCTLSMGPEHHGIVYHLSLSGIFENSSWNVHWDHAWCYLHSPSKLLGVSCLVLALECYDSSNCFLALWMSNFSFFPDCFRITYLGWGFGRTGMYFLLKSCGSLFLPAIQASESINFAKTPSAPSFRPSQSLPVSSRN